MIDVEKLDEFVEKHAAETYIHIEGREAELKGEGLVVGMALVDALRHVRDCLEGKARMALEFFIAQQLAETIDEDEADE